MENPKSRIQNPKVPTLVGVIGAGAMGRNHLRVLHDLECAELVALADAHEPTAQRSARPYGIPAYTDYKEMLDKEKPKAVVVAVPTIMHRDVALDVISRGIHLLIEKPIAFTEAAGQAILAAANAA